MRRPTGQLRALTLVEVVLSMVILGIAISAGVQALGSFAAGSLAWRERNTAGELANALMAEIDSLPFCDPSGSNTIARESGESADDRSTFDDIDDYDGWDVSPPRDKTNAALTIYDGYRQQVAVAFDTSLATKTGVALTANTFKKITVTILKDDKVLSQLITIRAKQCAMPDPH